MAEKTKDPHLKPGEIYKGYATLCFPDLARELPPVPTPPCPTGHVVFLETGGSTWDAGKRPTRPGETCAVCGVWT